MNSPIFIFSLPRAGSTLLQRILMGHQEICSISEPWILLPYIYASKKEGILSEYSSLTAHTGVEDFINNLPNQKKDYIEAQRKFITELYTKQCKKEEKYFLDKTPRYYLIIDEIVELFPDAKFIFIFRNPIQIYASIIKTWGKGRFRNIISSYYDLIKGTKKLSEGYIKHKEKSYAINYEDLILNSENKLEEICNYLEIPMKQEILTQFSIQDTRGNLGDPTGVLKYKEISDEGLYSWENVFNSSIRKRFAISLLKKLDDQDLLLQNYDKTKVISQIKKLNNKKNNLFFIDIIDFTISSLIRKFKLNLFINKNFKWIRKEPLS
ncbi:MAG: hypothetical protein ACI93N_000235 [Flavobacteriaceae bacterium]|jgi:hypothetical protein